MARARTYWRWGAIGILSVMLAFTEAFAGTTGKITGRVTDSSGNPLPGANVVLEGTQRGAVTDVEGYYVILSVEPGTYNLIGSLIGYNRVMKKGAKVTVDYTTTVNFTLKEEAIEAAELVVTAEKPPIEADKTSTKYVVTADEIESQNLVKSTGELISLMPGVDQAGTFSVRGSDVARGNTPLTFGTQSYNPSDVYVMVDGVRVPRQDGHSAILFTGVNKSAVQEISVETGVTPAEYGDAQAGTINIVTQEGSKQYHGWMELNYEPPGQKHWGANVYDAPMHRDHMKWDDQEWLKETDPLTGRLIHVREDYTSYHGYTAEGSISGPIGSKASFLASVKKEHRATRYPAASSHGFYNDRGDYINAPDNYQGSASLTFKPTASTKLKAGMILQRYESYNDEVNPRGYGDEGFIRGMRFGGRNLFLPNEWASSGRYQHQEDLAYLTFTHTLSPKTFYEIRVARSRTLRDTMNAPAWTEDSRKDKSGWFVIDRQVAMWMDSDRERWSVKGDLSSQVNKGNFVKTGFELIRYDGFYTFWSGRSKSDNWFTYYSGGDRPWEMGSPAKPIRGSLYAQDKMEFEGLIVNVGLRMDFNKHTHEELVQSGFMWAPMWRIYTHRQYGYGVGEGNGVAVTGNLSETPPTQFRFSPRLGISHPITDRMVMHFSLGRFVQWIDIYDLYSKSYRNYGRIGEDGDPTWRDVNGNGIKDPAEHLNVMETHYSGFGGDPWVHPEETLTFEVGADWNFVSDYTASLTTFYRNETQQIARGGTHWLGPKRGSKYTRGLGNAVAGYAKGIELAIGKRLSNYFSFRLSWTSQWTAYGDMGLTQYGASTRPDSGFVVSPQFWYDFQANADGSETPIPLTQEEKLEFGEDANQGIRSWQNAYADNPYRYFGQVAELDQEGIYVRYGSLGGSKYGPLNRGEKVGGRLGQANVQFVLSTPSDVKLGMRWMNWMVSNVNANMLWRMRTGQRYRWTPPGEQRRVDRGPMDTVTDLSVEKVFNSGGRVRPTLFVEVRNLFDQKDDADRGQDYIRWGLQMARPDNSDFLQYGDFGDRSYFHSPREVNLGIRMTF